MDVSRHRIEIERLGARIVQLDKDPDELSAAEFTPGTLFYFGPSPGRPGVGGTLEGARAMAENTRGKWMWRFRGTATERGMTGMSESVEKVFEDCLPRVTAWAEGRPQA